MVLGLGFRVRIRVRVRVRVRARVRVRIHGYETTCYTKLNNETERSRRCSVLGKTQDYRFGRSEFEYR